MDKNDKDIRKEIEELEKLIDKVKKQNEEEKRKQKSMQQKTVVKINLASAYANNFWINMLFSFLVNFIVIFAVLKLFDFVTLSNDLYIIYLVFIFTVIEEFYKRYLLKKQIKLVLFTSGMIFTFLNIVLFYIIDLFIFVDALTFNNYLYPIAFVILFQVTRSVIKQIYLRYNHMNMLKRIKRK